MTSLRLQPAAIPPASTRTAVDTTAPTLVWVRTGTAEVTVDGVPQRLASGQALWLPASRHVVVRGAAGSSVLPVRVRGSDRDAGPLAVTRFAVASEQEPLLLAAFARSLGVLHGGGVRAAALLHGLGQHQHGIAAPALPRSPDLLRVAESLLGSPTASPSDVAGAQGLGESALTRRFRVETGWTPRRWQTRSVLARAAARIREEGGVAAGLAVTGYSGPQAFARAFRREWGISPSELLATRCAAVVADRRAAVLGPQCTGYHVVLWVAAGCATLQIDDTVTAAHAGDLVCLPAGAIIGYRAEPGSAVVPLGWLPGGTALPAGIVAHAGPESTDALIRLAAWTYTGLGPIGAGDPRHTLEALLGVGAAEGLAPHVADAAHAVLAQLSSDPADDRTTFELAHENALEPDELRTAIGALTGTTLPVWRARTRMGWARRLLRDGVPTTQVARRLGFADAASFSRAFTRAHGCPPSRYRQRELREAHPEYARTS
ncbi:helix-turn-helix domain-containing protein [Microbacterium sp. SORGH_AS_0888]|uniref:helix-turn-helix domain-containing protein n=1 Tax=Microbacterium sp. SORGH_AS_0888 TaxID=3041791 RepID=UPI00278A3E79|nr:helix-turn-helix domain-containing protein [Microbacterium sp. SORGH_AS_0888]MDQ1128935.1 AraC-like DNA-binding protein/quercetin dioxygenase-like cupin family protein [Microbacterium sp. SORGH_AS_0888]